MVKTTTMAAAVFCLLLAGTGIAQPAEVQKSYMEMVAKPVEGPAAGQQGKGIQPLQITPEPGNGVHYWRDAAGNVLGISRRGQIVWLEMPANEVHIGTGDVATGYALDYGLGANYWDTYDSWGPNVASDFQKVSYKATPKGSSYPGKLITRPLKVRAKTMLPMGISMKCVITWIPENKKVTLKAIWKNESGTTINTIMAPKYWWDVDLHLADAANNFARTDRGGLVWVDPSQMAVLSPSYQLSIYSNKAPNITPFILDYDGDGFVNSYGAGPPSWVPTDTGDFYYQGDAGIGLNTKDDSILPWPQGGKKKDVFNITVN